MSDLRSVGVATRPYRPIIEQATGALMSKRSCSAARARAILVNESERTNRPVTEVAAEIMAAVRAAIVS
jgi:AmiR/NasT family two-component response regulator